MSEEYNIGFNTTEASARIDALISKLNTLSTSADKVDGKSIDPVSGKATGKADDLKKSLDSIFSTQLLAAQALFAKHLDKIESESAATSKAVNKLTETLSKNKTTLDRRVISGEKEAATSKNIQKQLESEAAAQQRLNAVKSAAKVSAAQGEPDVMKASVLSQKKLADERRKILEEDNAASLVHVAKRKQALSETLSAEQKGYKKQQAALSSHYKQMEVEAIKGRKKLAAASAANFQGAVAALTVADSKSAKDSRAATQAYYLAQEKAAKATKTTTKSMLSGAQATAAWRAGLNATGASMGILPLCPRYERQYRLV